jgi:hypothetical protein
MARGHRYTKEQDEFIRNNYTNVSECVRKFNEKFNTQQSYQAIKTYANRKLGITTGFRPWTKEMDDIIATLLWHHPYKEATKLFNKQFGTNFTRKQVQDHCTTVGISREQSKKLKKVDAIIKENANEKSYGEIRKIVNKELGMDYTNDTTICARANNLGITRPHRVWTTDDKRTINGEEVTFSEYVRFIGNRWHRLDKSIQPLALLTVKLQYEVAKKD